MQNTSKHTRMLLEKALELMATDRASYTLANFNSAVENLTASADEKNKIRNIAGKAFDAGTSFILL